MSFAKVAHAALFLLVGLAGLPSGWAQTYTVLYTFTGGADGAFPGGLVQDSAGNLYGTTRGGGLSGYGTVFKFCLLYTSDAADE